MSSNVRMHQATSLLFRSFSVWFSLIKNFLSFVVDASTKRLASGGLCNFSPFPAYKEEGNEDRSGTRYF